MNAQTDYVHAAQPKKKCLHTSTTKENRRCKDCGAPTRSHELEGKVAVTVTCNECGETVKSIVPAVQCHKCFTRTQETASSPGSPLSQ